MVDDVGDAQVVKKPGQDNTPIMSEMDLTYKERYTDAYIPEAYERLILDAIRGDQQHFVRRWQPYLTSTCAVMATACGSIHSVDRRIEWGMCIYISVSRPCHTAHFNNLCMLCQSSNTSCCYLGPDCR